MSVNKYQSHIFVLPEDDAHRQLANGFLLDASLNSRAIQVLPPAGGWMKVLNDLTQTHAHKMKTYPHRHMILLINFDQDADRLGQVMKDIPDELQDRVFVLGVWSEPENLKSELGKSYEDIGRMLAEECRNGLSTTWNHE